MLRYDKSYLTGAIMGVRLCEQNKQFSTQFYPYLCYICDALLFPLSTSTKNFLLAFQILHRLSLFLQTLLGGMVLLILLLFIIITQPQKRKEMRSDVSLAQKYIPRNQQAKNLRERATTKQKMIVIQDTQYRMFSYKPEMLLHF